MFNKNKDEPVLKVSKRVDFLIKDTITVSVYSDLNVRIFCTGYPLELSAVDLLSLCDKVTESLNLMGVDLK